MLLLDLASANPRALDFEYKGGGMTAANLWLLWPNIRMRYLWR